VKANYYVSDENSARRQPFLETDGELLMGFKAPLLFKDSLPEKFSSKEKAIEDLILQIDEFEKYHQTNKIGNYPLFGELNSEQ